MTGSITLANGDSRIIEQSWPDGSYSCPWCSAGVQASDERCMNPACLTQYADAGRVQTLLDEYAAREAEKERRAQEHERSMARLADEKAAREQRFCDAIAKAESEGFCKTCVHKTFSPYASERTKYVRHRDENYHEAA